MFYKNIEGWFDYEDLYDSIAQQIPENHIFVEIGVWKGKSICFLAERIKQLNKKVYLFGVDPFKHEMEESVFPPESRDIDLKLNGRYFETINNLASAGVLQFVNILPLYSEDAAKLFNDKSVSFLFIDGNHNYEYVKQDLENWYPKITDVGYIAGHDYRTGPQIKRAVDEFFVSKNKTVRPVSNVSYLVQNNGLP